MIIDMELGESGGEDHQHVHLAIRNKDISMGRKVYILYTNEDFKIYTTIHSAHYVVYSIVFSYVRVTL